MLWSARLQLRVFYFFEALAPEIRKMGLLKAFETASTLIEMVNAVDLRRDFLIYSPFYLYRMLILAAIVLLKIISSKYSCLVDVTTGTRNFNASIHLLRRCSLEDNDNYGRSSKILSQLWCFHRTSPGYREDIPSLRINTRLGASILHDTLWIWRQQFGEQAQVTSLDPQCQENNAHVDNGQSSLETLAPMIGDVSESITGLEANNWLWDLGLPSFVPIVVDNMGPSGCM